MYNTSEIMETISMISSKVGGASGPLYGTAYMQAGKVCAGKTSLTPEDGKAIFEAVIAGIQKRGKAVKGEKTMLDAIQIINGLLKTPLYIPTAPSISYCAKAEVPITILSAERSWSMQFSATCFVRRR